MSVDARALSAISSVQRTGADNVATPFRAQRDGALFTSDWTLGLAMEGRVYVGNAGTASDTVTFGAGTIDTTEPDFDLSIPAGTLAIPLEIRIYMERYDTSNTQFECMASVGTGGSQGATTTSVNARNIRADAPNTSLATAVAASSSDAVYMTSNVAEFWRDGQQATITKTGASATVSSQDPVLFIWRYSDSLVAPIMYSSSVVSRLNVFASSVAGTGFITVTWAELPDTAIA